MKPKQQWRLVQSGFYKKNLNDKNKFEEGNRQCNIEKVLKRHIIPCHENEIWFVQLHTSPHTTTQTTQIVT